MSQTSAGAASRTASAMGFLRRVSARSSADSDAMVDDLKAPLLAEVAVDKGVDTLGGVHSKGKEKPPPANSLAAARARFLKERAERADREKFQASKHGALGPEALEARPADLSGEDKGNENRKGHGRMNRTRSGEVRARDHEPQQPDQSSQLHGGVAGPDNCPANAAGGGNAVEQDIQLMTEGSYAELNERYGLTGERVMRYELVGVGRDQVAQLRSLFLSLDEDGGGELGPLELYDALIKFGQKVTDKQVKEMMDEVDTDNSGTIGYEEFLMLAVPGASSSGPKKVRDLSISNYMPASFVDTMGNRSSLAELREKPLVIPAQCFASYNADHEFLPKNDRGKHDTIPDRDGESDSQQHRAGRQEHIDMGANNEPTVNRSQQQMASRRHETDKLELRLKFNMDKSRRVTLPAKNGTIERQTKIVNDCWTPKRYLFGNKELAPRDGKGSGLVFTAPESVEGQMFPGPPQNKLLCVQFPGKKKEITLGDGIVKIQGFPITQITKTKMRISFEIPKNAEKTSFWPSIAHSAIFPPPVDFITILSCGAGTGLSRLRRIVADECFLPHWYPFTFSSSVLDDAGKPRRLQLKEDLGELENLPTGLVAIDVHLNNDDMVSSLIRYESARYPWLGDLEVIDHQPQTNVITEIVFRGSSVNINETASPLRIGLRMLEQVEEKTWRENRGWISCPPHPHVMPLLLTASANVFVFPYIEGVSGDLIADILCASLLKESQKKIVFMKIGLQVAWALEHMHSHDIWHLDLKPSNLIVTIDDTDPTKPRFHQQMHVRVCDFSRCSSKICANLSRRGTPGYWSPEQVHNRVDPEADLTPDLYWGEKNSKDPPPPSQADISERSDSWGWATMMLGLMGRLPDMRKRGYQSLIQDLLDRGFRVDLSAIFLYEQQAFIDLLQSELKGLTESHSQFNKTWNKLSEDVDRHKIDMEPVWNRAVEALQDLTEKDMHQLRSHRRPPPIVKLVTEAIFAIMNKDGVIDRKDLSNWTHVKEEIFNTNSDSFAKMLAFNKEEGLKPIQNKNLMRIFRNPDFVMGSFNDSNVRNEDPASPGSALAVATAFFLWITAVNEFHRLKTTLAPIQMEMKQQEKEMNKLEPKITKLQQKITKQTDELDVLKERLRTNNKEILELVRSVAPSSISEETLDQIKEKKKAALLKIKDILQMNGVLTDQQYKQIQKDCLYATGDHSQVFRTLAWLHGLPKDSTVRHGQPEGRSTRVFDRAAPSVIAASVKTVMDDLYSKFAILRATRPRDHHLDFSGGGKSINDSFDHSFSRTTSNASGISDFGRSASQALGRAPSSVNHSFSMVEDDDDDLEWDHFPTTENGIQYIFEKIGNDLPPQHKRHEIVGVHSTTDGVGDGFSLVLAWCLQHQPVDRLPIPAISAILAMLAPGQEWLHKGTVPGKAGLSKPGLDDSKWACRTVEVAPKLAAAMCGDQNDAGTELCLLEKQAISAFETRDLMRASNSFQDLIAKIEQVTIRSASAAKERVVCLDRLALSHSKEERDELEQKIALLGAEAAEDLSRHWMRLVSAKTALSRIRLRLGSVSEAEHWLQGALSLLLEHQIEDPGSLARSDISLRYHQAQGKQQINQPPKDLPADRGSLIQQRLVWADVKMQEAAILVSKTTENGENLYARAFSTLHCTATMLQELLGPESSKVSSALRAMGEVQALRGRFRDALDIYKRSLRIETRARGYDGYGGHPCIADTLHSMGKIQTIMGKYQASIGLLQRAIHIYASIDSQGLDHPKIPEVQVSLGQAFQGCLRYGEASYSFQAAFDCTSKRILANEQQSAQNHPMACADDLMQHGSLALILGNPAIAKDAYLRAADIYKRELTGINWFGDQLEDNSEMAVSECLLGAGAAQSAMGSHWKALELYQKAYQLIVNRTQDEQNLGLADICERMATTYVRMDKKGIALEWLTRALKIRELCQGRLHVDVARTLTRLSAVFRSIGQYNVAQSYTVRSLHMYVAVFERNHLCVADAIENLAATNFPIAANDYNSNLRKHAALKLQLQSNIARVGRCKARAESALQALVKLKKTPGIKKAALAQNEEALERARNAVTDAEANQRMTEDMLKLRQGKCTISKAQCDECLAMVEESVLIVRDILPDPCQKLNTLRSASKHMSQLLQSLLKWADVYASKTHTEASSPVGEDGTGSLGGFSRKPSVAKSGVALQSIGESAGDQLTDENVNVGIGTNPLVEPATPRSTQLASLHR